MGRVDGDMGIWEYGEIGRRCDGEFQDGPVDGKEDVRLVSARRQARVVSLVSEISGKELAGEDICMPCEMPWLLDLL